MLVFGITGGSGAGKTTASDIFRQLGVYVIDADKAARKVVEKGQKCLEELTDFFGKEILKPDGTLDRKKLGEIVFADLEKLGKLNEITHKYILWDIKDTLYALECDYAAIDGAVIIGSEVEKLCSFMVSVMADYDVRLERIKKRDGMTEKRARERLQSQPKDEFYIENSKYLIYNNSNEDCLRKEVVGIFEEIKKNEV